MNAFESGPGTETPGYSSEQLRLFRRLVRPFYLRMALVEGPTEVDPRAARRFRRTLVRAGSKVTSKQVGLMLRGAGLSAREIRLDLLRRQVVTALR